MFLLAQLVEPPLQPGPVRLPSRPALERQRRRAPESGPILEQPPSEAEPNSSEAVKKGDQANWRPVVRGRSPYSAQELKSVLQTCGNRTFAATLKGCASALTARLIRDGYINSRVFINPTPFPGELNIVLGTIAELQIDSADPTLEDRVRQQLDNLIGTVLHLPTLEESLVEVRRRGVGSIKGNLGRLGSDPTKAVINLTVEPVSASPLKGEFSISNDGNTGSGEWRATTTLLQNNLISRGDTGLLFLELDADGQLELGTAVASGSYTVPLNENWYLTGSLGTSYRRFVEFRKPAYNFSFRTLQGLIQLETALHRGDNMVWTASAAVSANRNNSFESGKRPSVPLIAGGSSFLETNRDWDSWTRTGYLRLSTDITGTNGESFWGGSVFMLQGIAAFTPDQHLRNFNQLGIEPGSSRAVGASGNMSFNLWKSARLNLRAAGQYAFSPLPGSMGFVLGSDTGLKGLPGAMVSGDSGWLGVTDITWTLWQRGDRSLQFIPFIGMGGIRTESSDSVFEDSLGAGGMIARYRQGPWQIELGWVDTFETDDAPGLWNHWVLGNGLYTKLFFRF